MIGISFNLRKKINNESINYYKMLFVIKFTNESKKIISLNNRIGVVESKYLSSRTLYSIQRKRAFLINSNTCGRRSSHSNRFFAKNVASLHVELEQSNKEI